MANQGDFIYKCNSTKVDTGVKKNNRPKISGWDKSAINKNEIKQKRQRFFRLT